MFVEALRRLRRTAEAYADRFASEGFSTLFAMLRRELGEEYSRYRRGTPLPLEISPRRADQRWLGAGNMGVGHVLRKPNDDNRP